MDQPSCGTGIDTCCHSYLNGKSARVLETLVAFRRDGLLDGVGRVGVVR